MDAEIEYWRRLLATSSRDSAGVEFIIKHLVDYLAKSLQDLQQANPRDALDTLETVDLQLTELWKQKESALKPFPEDRMRNLFHIFESAVLDVIRNAWRDVKMWSSGFRQVEDLLADCRTLCERWIDLCHTLTVEVWTEFANPWGSTPVVPTTVIKMKLRLNEVLTLRAVVNDTASLVGTLEKPGPLEAFRDVDALNIAADNEGKWGTALRNFDLRMERYENTVVENLKTKFHDADSASLQILMEFRKCRSVIGRTKVKLALTAERLDVSSRLMDIEQPSGRLIVNFSDRLVTLIKEVRYFESIGFRVPEVVKERHDLAKKFYDSGIVLMQVAHFYNTIDQQMINCQKPMLIESAKRFEQVIRSVKGSGKSSSGTSITSGDVRWSDLKRVEAYVNEVHDSTLALTQENRRLRSLHQKIVSIVIQMADTNLIQKLSEWKRLLNEIHKIVSSVAVESHRYPAENMTPWRLHIDHQIKKALDIQLRKCLSKLSDSLPDMQVDVVYRHHLLQFRPSIQELRETFSLELQKLFSIPSSLKPISELSGKRDLFRQVTLDCHLEAAMAQKNMEAVLIQLEKVLEESQQYVVLGSVHLYALVEARVVDVQDWERELKSLNQRSRSTDQIPLQIKVENVTINFGPLRTAIDGIIQDTQDALVNTLRRSLLAEVDAVSEFVASANAVLSTQPTTTEELTTLSADFHNLIRESDDMKSRLMSVNDKNALLKSTIGKGVEKSETVLRSWTSVLSMLEDHKSVMRDQTSALRERVQKEILVMETAIEKFEARWKQARPTDDRLDDLSVTQIKAFSETVKSKREDLDVIVKRQTELNAQCVQLDIPLPPSAVLDRVKADLDTCDVTWKELLDFSLEVETLSLEDWLTFRNKLYRFEDLLKSWTSRLQVALPTAFTLRVQKEIASYRAALPSLKICRGESFSEEHWAELFALLELKDVNVEQLTLGHFVGACKALIKESAAIKDLAARAQAEVSIREAIRELEIWGAAAVFHLTTYTDALGQQVQIVKDWSDLLSAPSAMAWQHCSAGKSTLKKTGLVNGFYLVLYARDFKRQLSPSSLHSIGGSI
ncbi:Cytoplasmic dynein 2 heavy chain 1 [Hypsibius exemplaris]|uniref:Cytoplasmic dynein 2 heavy chain 1 n=1 Tax=Hypsibius exemplaris TaxID=2072580 RepID=A0A1W0WH11_HYPEX|nr:Cytoplasmic dynein 2 heavy chain 1 [Hypsibius exemplaris]